MKIAIDNAFSVRIQIIFLFPSHSLRPLSANGLLVSSLRGGRAIDLCGARCASHPMLPKTTIADSFLGGSGLVGGGVDVHLSPARPEKSPGRRAPSSAWIIPQPRANRAPQAAGLWVHAPALA